MPAHKTSAKTRASRENIKKAHEARRQKAVEKRLLILAEFAKSLDEKIVEAKQLMPGMIKTAIVKYLESQPKKNLVKWFKEILFKFFDEAGGMERLKKLAKQNKIFLKLVDQCIILSKADTETKRPPQGNVVVNFIGLDDPQMNKAVMEINSASNRLL